MADPFDAEEFVAKLKELVTALPENVAGAGGRGLKQLRGEIATAVARLDRLRDELDPIRQPDSFFDPSSPATVGIFIGKTLLDRPRVPLASLSSNRFYGSGVYAIYYRGSFKAYKPVRATETPVYVGKADPEDANAHSPREQGDKLWGRLNDHVKSISAASTTLSLADFDRRYLVVRSAWQNTAESYLIDLFKPVWNNEVGICYGFGKHGDSADTRGNTRSPWDTVHPGRAWATRAGNKPNPKSAEQISADIAEHYKKSPPRH